MTRIELLRRLDEVIDQAPGYLKGDEPLVDVEGWDSLAVLDFIAMADEEFGLSLSGEAIGRCATVGDIVRLCAAGPEE